MATPKAGPNSAAPTTAEVVGGVYNATTPALNDGQATALQTDASGNLKVNVITGGGSSNVNIANVAGNPPGLNNPLPVELSDGTNAFGTSGNPLSENIAQWGGTAIQAAQTSNTDGTGASPVVRATPRRFQSVFNTTPLGAGATFTSAWIDTQQTGDVFVYSSVRADQNSGTNSFFIEETDDTTDSNFTRTVNVNPSGGTPGVGLSVLANTTTLVQGYIRGRYWRTRYVNGATPQGSFKITALGQPFLGPLTTGATALSAFGQTAVTIIGANSSSVPGDGVGIDSLIVASLNYYATTTGSFAQARTPNTFKTVQATSSGNTALWTPTSGKKFRLMRFMIQITGNSTITSGAVLTVSFQDSSTAINIAMDSFIPSSALTTADDFVSPWVDLGNGFLSAAANNVLNVNLSSALTAGNVRVTCCGTEE